MRTNIFYLAVAKAEICTYWETMFTLHIILYNLAGDGKKYQSPAPRRTVRSCQIERNMPDSVRYGWNWYPSTE